LRLNKVEDATRSYYAALEISPNDTEALLAVASICIAVGKTDDAIMLLNRVLTLDPQNPAAISAMEVASQNTPRSRDNVSAQRSSPDTASISGNPLISIVIPVYNKLDFTEKCLESIRKNVRYPNYEVIVVDNASVDGTREFVMELSPRENRVRYIRNESNLGFVDACNLGAERANGEYVLLLNNDTTVNEGWLEALVAFAEKTPDCGAVGSKLLYPDGRLQEAGGITFSDANGWNYGRGMNPNHPKFTFVREVDYISGASLMVRKSLWEKIGGLDRRYAPAYYEDADLCFAIRKLGYKVYYEPRSSLVHFERATSGTNLQQGFKKYQLINRPKFAEKWEKELASQRRNDPRNVEVASSGGITGRILVVDPILPMFDRAAGSLHLFNILKVLRSLNFSITFIATNLGLFNRYKPILEEMGIETYAGDQEAMKYFGHNLVYPRVDYASLFREREFDFALIDFWYQAEYYLPLIRKYSPRTRIIIDTEDVHFVREIREAELKEDAELKTRALGKKKREIAVYGKADSVWVVTEQDRQALLDAEVITPIDIRPVIHEVPEVKNNYAAREGILFVGNFNHTPNIDAVRFFVTEVLPEVHKSLPEVVLDIVGNDPTNLTGPLASDRIRPIGYVQDLSKYYEKCRLVVAPLRYGAGLKGKIVEALSYGVPVVTTSIGVEGMKLRDGQDIFVADDPAV
ncbi:MAG TPA: glycosyltransferase, partial [Candidatus Kryptobacter bacterium]|nr:glycosyltransferase [Candidatus Kryptobacter bacterium]